VAEGISLARFPGFPFSRVETVPCNALDCNPEQSQTEELERLTSLRP